MSNKIFPSLIVIFAWVELLDCFSKAVHSIIDRNQIDGREHGDHQIPLLQGLSGRWEQV